MTQTGSSPTPERIWQIMIAHLVAFIEDLKNLSVAEIHHRRT